MSSTSGNDWLEYCSWENVEGQSLSLALTGARGHDPDQKLLGYHCADHETYLAFIIVTLHGLGHMYNDDNECQLYLQLCLAVDEVTHELAWKLNSMSTQFPHGIADRTKLVQSLEDLERVSTAVNQHSPNKDMTGDLVDGEEDVDDYWGQYDHEEVVAEGPTIQGSDAGSVDYYDRYESQVETAIQAPEDSPSEVKGSQRLDKKEYSSLLPDIVHHAESSLRNLRTLCHAASLSDEQIGAIFRKVMEEQVKIVI